MIRKTRNNILIFAFFSCLKLAFSQGNDSELILSHDRLYDFIMYRAVLKGEASLAIFAPATLYELQAVGAPLPFYRQKKPALLESSIAFLDSKPSVSFSLRSNPSTKALFSSDLIKTYNETAPFFSFPLHLGFGNSVTLKADYVIKEGYWASHVTDSYSAIPFSLSSIDANFPSSSYISYGNSFVSAVIGRGSLRDGRTQTGSMILSDSADRLDFALLSFYSRSIRLSLKIIEAAPNRYFYFHDLSVKILPFLAVGISEAASVASTLDLRYLNPPMAFHNYAGWRDTQSYKADADSSPVGTQFASFIEIVPFSGLRAYGQFVMNQFQTEYELNNFSQDAAIIPNSLGALAGLEYIHPYKKGFCIFALEGMYSNPWLYMLSNHAISFYWTRRELVAPQGYTTVPIQVWLGSPYGPDTLLGAFKYTYDIPESHRFSASYRFVAQGNNAQNFLENSEDTYYPKSIEDAKKSTPSNSPKYQHSLQLSLLVILTKSLEVEGKVGYSLLKGSVEAQSINASSSVRIFLR